MKKVTTKKESLAEPLREYRKERKAEVDTVRFTVFGCVLAGMILVFLIAITN